MRPPEAVVKRFEVKWVEPLACTRPSALRRVLGCRVLTAWQQAAFGIVFAVLGVGVVLAWELNRIAPTVTVLDPVIERFEKDYSVYKLRFAAGGVELAPCHLVVYGESGKWNVRCWGGAGGAL